MRSVQSFIPACYRLEKCLREQILTASLEPGDSIPPESQLAQQFNVSRMTVRQALSRLVFEGLIVRHRGRGSFVADPRLEHTKMFLSF
jgi:GntR family transcriptional regulator